MEYIQQFLQNLLTKEKVKTGLLLGNLVVTCVLIGIIGFGFWSNSEQPPQEVVVSPQPVVPSVVTPPPAVATPQTPEQPSVNDSVSAPPESAVVEGKINLNTAQASLLQELPGIGPQKAQAIIEYRQQTPFQQVSDIVNVSGIGEKTYEKLKELITVQ